MYLGHCNDNNIVADKIRGYAVVCHVGKPIVFVSEYIQTDSYGDSLCVWQTLHCERTE